MTTPTETQALDIAAFDKDCKEYLELKRQESEAKRKASEVNARLLATVLRHGSVPTNAEKSRRVEGPGFIATVTTGMSIEIDDVKVFDLELLLSRLRLARVFKLLFERRVEHTLAKTAKFTIEQTKWPKKHAEQIVQLYSACFSPKTSTPSLKVVPRPEAGEVETKAAKKPRGGKQAA